MKRNLALDHFTEAEQNAILIAYCIPRRYHVTIDIYRRGELPTLTIRKQAESLKHRSKPLTVILRNRAWRKRL